MNADCTNPGKVKIPADSLFLDAELVASARAKAVVLFAQVSGGRSERRKLVAQKIKKAGLGYLLFDLLTPPEKEIDARTRHLRFDIDMLAGRLIAVCNWLVSGPAGSETKAIGLLASNTGVAAALVAASALGKQVGAVVSWGGRPDLAGAALQKVSSPVLLIAGDGDEAVVEFNKPAYEELRCEKQLKIITGSKGLFDEPGKLELVAHFSTDWFRRFLMEK